MHTAATPHTERSLLAPWLLVLTVAVGTGLRVYGVDRESAWLDEAFSVGIARVGLAEVWYQTRLDVHPPLYYVLLTGWMSIVGDTLLEARLLSILFSVLLLGATYEVGRTLVGRRVGLAAAALLAVSVFHVEFAQEARMYSQLALLATLSTLGFIGLFEARARPAVVVYVIATTLMVWTHVYAWFVIGAQGLSIAVDLAWRRRAAIDAATRWVWCQVLVVAAFLPWLPVFTWQLSLVQDRFWIADPAPWGFLAALGTYTGSPALLWLAVPLAALGTVRLSLDRGGSSPRPAAFFLIPWLAGPILIPFLLSRVSQPIFLPKYTIAASVPFAILVAAGVYALPFRLVRVGVLATCLAWSASLLPAFYGRQSKDGWRQAVPIVERLAQPADTVVLYPYFNKIAWDFYARRDDLRVRAFPLFAAPPPADGWPVTLTRATADRDRVWLVTLQADGSVEDVVAALGDRYRMTTHQVRQKIAIYRFDRQP